MTNLRWMLIVCFFAAFGAGLTTGLLWERAQNTQVAVSASTPDVEQPKPIIPVGVDTTKDPVKDPAPQAPKPPVPNGTQGTRNPGPPMFDNFLLRDLKLTKEQNDQMKEIWGEVMRSTSKNSRDERDRVRREKEEAIHALFNNEMQRDLYLRILSDTEKKYEDLNKENQTIQENAVAKTRAILTPEQQAKYDELRKKSSQQWHRGGWGGGGSRPDGKGPDGGHGRGDGRRGPEKPQGERPPAAPPAPPAGQ